MKRAVILGGRQAGLVDAPRPKAKGPWVLVKVMAAPLCTEWKTFVSGGASEFLGHEAAGEVVEVDEPGPVQPGDRVVVMPSNPCGSCPLCVSGDYIHCEHTHNFAAVHGSKEGSATVAEYLLKPGWLLPRIPDGVSYEHASMACCGLGPSYGAFRVLNAKEGETALITGAGPVGTGALIVARSLGLRPIMAEPSELRRERALAMGADAVVDPSQDGAVAHVRDLTEGRGADLAIDCAGNPRAERFCMEAVRRKGRVAFVGECGDELAVKASPDFIRRGISVSGSWHYNLNDFPHIMRIIQESPLIDSLITHVMPMSQIQEALELASTGQAGKIVLQPGE